MSRKQKHQEFAMDHRGELDEVFVPNASVHIERMGRQCYWIGIEGKGMPRILIFTGQHRGTWYFNVSEDLIDGQQFNVQVKRKVKP